MITARTVLLAAVVLASWVLASTIGAALSEGKTYGGARVKVPNSITVGKRFLVKASRFPPNAKLVLRAVPYAQRGGNCELTEADRRVVKYGVTILGPTNIAADVAFDASQMFSHNVSKFVLNLVGDDGLPLDANDEIIRETLITRDRQIVHPRVRGLLGLPPLELAPK